MRILIDLQACQSTGSRDRGIGRYSLALAQAMARHAGQHELSLMLSGAFPETVIPLRQHFASLVPPERIKVWHAPGPVAENIEGSSWRRRAGEMAREQALAELRPDFVHVASLFEGLTDDALTSLGSTGEPLPTAVTLYDLIPLANAKQYLASPLVRDWYYRKALALKNADLLLAISESSRREGIDWLQLPAERVVNISSAVDHRFQVRQYDPAVMQELRGRYGLTRPFVMYTGGIDLRKNIDALIRSYAALPAPLRMQYQLAIVCSVQQPERERLQEIAQRAGMAKDELVLTGFVLDEALPMLYNDCALFVFPSWHEGFGLPALEAMACGAPVIASNTSSLPEVMGRGDALFDPHSEAAITAKMHEALTNAGFRASLRAHGLEQAKKFSWDASGKRALTAFEEAYERRNTHALVACNTAPARKPRLAFVSPLPPERCGIADYSAELLPELARYYDIELIVDQKEVSDPWLRANFPVRDWKWFDTNADRYDRIVYHFGNSPFHAHMFGLLARHPGTVVLHDFFLSHIASHLEFIGLAPHGWAQALYESHGYKALLDNVQAASENEIVWKYPCNIAVLRQAAGIIVHSKYSLELAQRWYGAAAAEAWQVISLIRKMPATSNRAAAREQLGLSDDDFLVCSFGLLGPSKLNHRLLDAWHASPLAQDVRCRLVFVGENNAAEYSDRIVKAIKSSPWSDRISVTGFAAPELFRTYLAAADVAVQLRTMTRGETSAAVLDCMAHGVATIVNDHGAMADLPGDVLVKLPDQFADAELAERLRALRADTDYRRTLGQRGTEYIRTHHAPARVGEDYFHAIEGFVRELPANRRRRMYESVAAIDSLTPPSDADLVALAQCVSMNCRTPGQKQLLVDVTTVAQVDAKSGIQRVVRGIVSALVAAPPQGYRIEPVIVTEYGLRYARRFTCGLLGLPAPAVGDELVEAGPDDVFVGLDLNCNPVVMYRNALAGLRINGVKVIFVVYDLLPVLRANCFPEELANIFGKWLATISEVADGAVCISRSVADELLQWMQTQRPERQGPFRVGYFHLGADIEASLPTAGDMSSLSATLDAIGRKPSFLMVGTLEPRKGHAQALDAFERLWAQGVEACLLIVGGAGWKTGALAERIHAHSEYGRRLFWIEKASDEVLERLYRSATALLMASEGEGFGLPLIEAARHDMPIVARELPVFREIAGEHAFYFSGMTGEDLASALRQWLALREQGTTPASTGMPWLTWAQSAGQLCDAVLRERWYGTA
jgi:glycosyltransferase involved in cell wall biosynthesis